MAGAMRNPPHGSGGGAAPEPITLSREQVRHADTWVKFATVTLDHMLRVGLADLTQLEMAEASGDMADHMVKQMQKRKLL